jgi:hypothetical protein
VIFVVGNSNKLRKIEFGRKNQLSSQYYVHIVELKKINSEKCEK